MSTEEQVTSARLIPACYTSPTYLDNHSKRTKAATAPLHPQEGRPGGEEGAPPAPTSARLQNHWGRDRLSSCSAVRVAQLCRPCNTATQPKTSTLFFPLTPPLDWFHPIQLLVMAKGCRRQTKGHNRLQTIDRLCNLSKIVCHKKIQVFAKHCLERL